MSSYPEHIHILPDYHLDVWLSQLRKDEIKSYIVKSLPLLLASNVLEQTLRAWSELEILKELQRCRNIMTNLELEDSNLLKIDSNMANFEKSRMLIIQAWSNCHWANRLESMYLDKKDMLEKVSFCMINVGSNELAYEIYHRFKAGEESFGELFNKYDLHKDKLSNNGQYKLKPIKGFPAKMHPVLRRLDSGEVLKPFANGNQFSILVMDSWHPALFDETTKNLLLYDEFSDWQKELIDRLKSHLLPAT